ncbi:hypothetical protein J6590_008710 [Homalodisca vitripennis]|nr:hypothetical protein J6590_008710 [Homalodisca vitripennis]
MTRLSQQSLFGIQDVPNNLKFRQFRQLGEISISGIRSVDPKYLEARSKLDPLATMRWHMMKCSVVNCGKVVSRSRHLGSTQLVCYRGPLLWALLPSRLVSWNPNRTFLLLNFAKSTPAFDPAANPWPNSRRCFLLETSWRGDPYVVSRLGELDQVMTAGD